MGPVSNSKIQKVQEDLTPKGLIAITISRCGPDAITKMNSCFILTFIKYLQGSGTGILQRMNKSPGHVELIFWWGKQTLNR